MKRKTELKKLAAAALLCALAVVCSPLSIPVGASKCFPIQHLVNVLCGVFLGPWYGLGAAFVTSLIRNILGTGSLLAFPGSMCGAFLCGFLYQKFKKLPLAYVGEVVGTGLIGAMLCFPIATLVMSKEAALFTYVIPFGISSLGGTIIAIIFVTAFKKAGLLDMFDKSLNT